MDTVASGFDDLSALVGEEHVRSDPGARILCSTDLSFRETSTAAAVVAPGSVGELVATVELAGRKGMAIVARGGGSSYSLAYTPAHEQTLVVDLRRLDRIVEISADDLYVTVECGCTWEALDDELAKHDLRARFWGPSSGAVATVGGALSNNAVLFGSSRYGTAADSTLGLDVVTASHGLLSTGSGARNHNPSPFFRYFGPDLTGLFLGDCGAFGIKATATLTLTPTPTAIDAIAFGYQTLPDALTTMHQLAQTNLAAELYGLETFHHRTAANAGHHYLADEHWTIHATVEAPSQPILHSHLDHLRTIARTRGHELPTAFTLAGRMSRFHPLRARLLGPDGEVALPTHTIIPFSRAEAVMRATNELFAAEAERLERHGISTSFATFVTGHDLLLERTLWWRDALDPLRLSFLEPEYAELYANRPPNLEARAVVLELRAKLLDVLVETGVVNMQIGKLYPYAPLLQASALASLRQLKSVLDPQRLMNPGALGL